MYIPQMVQSFEYMSAAFGSAPPVGMLPLVFADPVDGCIEADRVSGRSAGGYALVVVRGGCTFLEKALAAMSGEAGRPPVLVVVNTEDVFESIASGLGE